MNRHEFLTAIAGFAMVPFAATGLFEKKKDVDFVPQPFTDRAVAYAPTTMASSPTVAIAIFSPSDFDRAVNNIFVSKRDLT